MAEGSRVGGTAGSDAAVRDPAAGEVDEPLFLSLGDFERRRNDRRLMIEDISASQVGMQWWTGKTALT